MAPLKPQCYIVKLGLQEYALFFLFLLKNIDCGYSLEPPRRGGSNEYPQSMFWAEIWKISDILSENVQFLVVKFLIYLNRRVLVMIKPSALFHHSVCDYFVFFYCDVSLMKWKAFMGTENVFKNLKLVWFCTSKTILSPSLLADFLLSVPPPRWLSWMRVQLVIRRLLVRPRQVGNIISWSLIKNILNGHSLTFCWFKKGNCQFLAKECAKYSLTALTNPAQ